MTDPRLQVLAQGLEFTKRCASAGSLEDLHLLLTNDVRTVVSFDRSFLATHLGEKTRLVAVGNAPVLEEKSRFYEEAIHLAESFRSIDRGLLIDKDMDPENLSTQGVDDAAIRALRGYMTFSGSAYLLVVPLQDGPPPRGHLFLEYFEGQSPDQNGLMTLLNLSPLLAHALGEKWLLEDDPGLQTRLVPGVARASPLLRTLRRIGIVAFLMMAYVGLFHTLSLPREVGGEAEVVPVQRRLAFAGITGIVDEILVTEGTTVTADQLLARLDSREIDYELTTAKRRLEILEREMEFLQRSASSGELSKLPERELVRLKSQGAAADLEHARWRRQFLEIRAPVSGTLITPDIESLAGKKIQAGEAFCEVQEAGGLEVEVHVPDDRIQDVRPGLPAVLHLDSDPQVGHELVVERVAPQSVVRARLGNVFPVRARFLDTPPEVLSGMKGVGRIRLGRTDLYTIVRNRVLTIWGRLRLRFS